MIGAVTLRRLAVLLPAVLALGLIAVLFFERPKHFAPRAAAEPTAAARV